jgi:two-component system, OmpR family, sensor histidine kinase KdpD
MKQLRPWLVWCAVFAAATIVTRAVRPHVDPLHINLLYLLIVLGGSVSEGRALGLSLSAAAFLAIDYFFQTPYDSFTVGKSLDWVGLLAFLATSIVTSELVTRARAEAARARARTREIGWLARLGAEALNAPRLEDALSAITTVVRKTAGVDDCQILPCDEDGRLPADSARSLALEPGDPLARAAAAVLTMVAADGRAAVVCADRRLVRPGATPTEVDAVAINRPDARAVCLPLDVAGHRVGVLWVSGRAPFALDPERRRLLTALAYYAALATERARLGREAEHAAALREANRLKDFVLASVSHDLRTPLTTIKALAHAVARKGDAAGGEIEQQADRLSRLVANLLDLSRLQGGIFPMTLEPNTAEDLVGAVTRQVVGLLDGRRLTTAVDVTQPALVGRFDFVNSLRILNNLIENAIRVSPGSGTVELTVRRVGETLRFAVADRGPGVPPEERDRIFEPFYRAATALPDGGRMGLGLSIARRLADAQGGAVRYEPRPGGGSVFSLELPALDLPATAEVA